jgi:hypothetical protein
MPISRMKRDAVDHQESVLRQGTENLSEIEAGAGDSLRRHMERAPWNHSDQPCEEVSADSESLVHSIDYVVRRISPDIH